ncbi:Uncharacterized beta-barrel protein YwiB, DUF1934 family [Dethiosulfatibacter aminovorans DSM 17477]|uniref:Uncharacterized beta-barrel protein YwiB, DUF1934 family n=1 Tax=Dethiosulfatibacter aminovorans DSM 17477 TaxID=1121476 RepID=A0A1M6EAX8_9FIRM|nr:DUF1934 domain-containing protein [Dethiosulfatibacter aminovorans]SHI82667.1 Uncharacterized beta-barrel protein YwiB, DUF1934 family [Dethiosulfatibacter aminovorans DSM 17477]
MNKVKMKISGAQSTGNSKPHVTELTTDGVFEFTGDEYYYTYNESAISGMEGCTTTLITDGKKKIVLRRSGDANSASMDFVEGKSNRSQYMTEYGSFELLLRTSIVNCNIKEDGTGEIHLEYSMTFGGEEESRNKLNIRITN